jgi:hypothetical protein
MVTLKHSEMRIIDDALDMGGGYLLHFSDRTFAEFFDDEFGVAIYSEKYDFNGRSKAKHMRAFIATEDEYTVARVLRRFWEHRESIPIYSEAQNHESIKRRFFDLLAKIEGAAATPRTDAIDRFARDETLEELVAAIERDISANKPAAALDRLHTYLHEKIRPPARQPRGDLGSQGTVAFPCWQIRQSPRSRVSLAGCFAPDHQKRNRRLR